MKIKAFIGSTLAVGLLGLGMLVGSAVGAGSISAQTTVDTPQTTQSTTTQPTTDQSTTTQSTTDQSTITQSTTTQSTTDQTTTTQPAQVAVTQQQAEQTALAASPGNTVDHTKLMDKNGTSVYDVDFANGGGAIVDAQTGKIITSEAAGQDHGGRMGGGGADQAALAAKATVTKAQAEKTALDASPGNTVDHSRLGGDVNGTIYWDVDFANGGGATVDALTGKITATEAAGMDHGGRSNKAPGTTQP